jgi:hypothetical protein
VDKSPYKILFEPLKIGPKITQNSPYQMASWTENTLEQYKIQAGE